MADHTMRCGVAITGISSDRKEPERFWSLSPKDAKPRSISAILSFRLLVGSCSGINPDAMR